ncbi:Mu transposase C-terminal domain-containing protein [Thiohalophilus sp.]|uniref:Mu transposase C-terminal domain-containing protein n=1 Tax=Thiohalophilus sp. TaxID=3028392 RepID=UPI002ACEAA9D|nr:Mu transposase C-terminal domain-containing protein [Thiohalophilus sp.]MDZ7660924.1 Mu transposase C-terminal domain-containing protein [Thiohalophilus sp.]
MAKLSIGKGQELILDQRYCKVVRMIEANVWQVEFLETGKYETFAYEELMRMYMERKLKPANDALMATHMPNKEYRQAQIAWMEALPEKQRERAVEKYTYVIAVREAKLRYYTEETLNPVIDEVYEKYKKSGDDVERPNWSSVNRWRKKFIKSGQDIRSLVNQHDKKGNRERRYPQDLEEIIHRAINETYLTRERGTVKDTVDSAIAMVADENKFRTDHTRLQMPTWSIVKRLIQAIDKFDVVVAREGVEVAEQKFRAAADKIVATNILEYVQIDHTTMDSMLIDDVSLLPIGRPTLTVCIDVKSRSILGIYIGFEPASFVSVAQCLRHAFMPKVDLNMRYPSIEGKWIAFGIPENLIVDNGLEFHSDHLEDLCYSFGINMEYMPRKTPWFKPHVERFIGTLNRDVSHKTPGTTFSNIFEKGDYDPNKNAVMTLSSFKEVVHKWVVDVYHKSGHKGLGGKSPNEVWESMINDVIPPIPADPDIFDGLMGGTAKRVVSHQGVEFSRLQYNSKELREMRQRYGDRFETKIRYNPTDICEVYVEDPVSKRLLRVPVVGDVNKKYAEGLSLWQHKVICRHAMQSTSRLTIEALAKAKQDIRKIIEDDIFNKKLKTRKKQARFNEFDDPRMRNKSCESSPEGRQIEGIGTDASSSDEDLLIGDFDDVVPDFPVS